MKATRRLPALVLLLPEVAPTRIPALVPIRRAAFPQPVAAVPLLLTGLLRAARRFICFIANWMAAVGVRLRVMWVRQATPTHFLLALAHMSIISKRATARVVLMMPVIA